VVGASADPSVVRLAGLASLVAGACSMAVGEYISMRAQVELLERLLTEEREAIARNPAREAAILREVLLRDGIDPKAAEAICRQASRDPERALGIYSRAVLGVNPAELGSPWASALSSLVTFAAGAFVPLAPWLIATGPRVAPVSFVLAWPRRPPSAACSAGRHVATCSGRQCGRSSWSRSRPASRSWWAGSWGPRRPERLGSG